MKGREEKADYLESDLQWVRTTSEGVFDLNLVDGIFDSAVEKMRNGEELSEEESRLAGAVFTGDAEYLCMNRDWFRHRPVRFLIRFGDGAAHHKCLKAAKKFCDPSRLSMPDYSLPREYVIDGEKVTKHSDSFTQRAVLASTITSIDWLEYILTEMSVSHRKEFLDRTRRQMASFLVHESYELDADVAEFQRNMFCANVEWTENVEQRFSFSSCLADRICDRLDEVRESRLEKF
jgi:hypothetical protein